VAKVEVFDPPMCCSTGVCGPDPDERLTRFSADLEWLQRQGVEVRRYNLAQEPAVFTSHPQVQQLMNKTNGEALPLLMVDGRVALQGEYPTRDRLAELAGVNGAREAKPGAAASSVHALFDERVAELVAIGAAVAANCELCLDYHHRKAAALGVSREDMVKAVNLALQVREQPARMMARRAEQLLTPEAAQAGECCGGGSGGGCC